MATRDLTELDELMLRAAGGDEAAFRRFYDLSAPSILAFLLRLLPDRFHAEDVLQESMVTAWNRASDFDPERAAAKTWITTIARRRALDILRSRRRQADVLTSGADDIRETLGLEASTSGARTESSATEDRLRHCMNELKSEAATSIRLAYLDGLTFSEISTRIDRSLNSVKSWVRRGMEKLRECMQR